jgi:hypothetical protein
MSGDKRKRDEMRFSCALYLMPEEFPPVRSGGLGFHLTNEQGSSFLGFLHFRRVLITLPALLLLWLN